ncbi:MAG: hypothetical protein JXA08_04185 [Methanomicrobiaceae archaeon]|nr:hypothetical protein [Methanomicrobiaceae archaeon]
MARAIPSENMLAIALICAEGDVTRPMGEIVAEIEAWQGRTGRWLGESKWDFGSGFAQLGRDAGGRRRWTGTGSFYTGDSDPREVFGDLLLADFIYPCLKYDEFYCNDESEWWCRRRMGTVSVHNRLMRRFFADEANRVPDRVLSFLEENGWGPDFFTLEEKKRKRDGRAAFRPTSTGREAVEDWNQRFRPYR